MLTIKFEDFEFTNNQATINYYSNKKYQRKNFTIPDDLYNKVIEFKSTKERQGKYIEQTVTTPTGKEIVGHFIFNLTKSQLKRSFRENSNEYSQI